MSPVPSLARVRPRTVTLAVPSRIRKNPIPRSPSRASTLPSACETSLAARAIASSSRRPQPENSETWQSYPSPLAIGGPQSTSGNVGPWRRSDVDGRHVRVPVARRGPPGERRLDAGQVVLGQLDGEGAGVLQQVPDPLGARDGHDVVPPGEDPGQGELGGGDLLRLGDGLHPLHQVEVPAEVLALEPGMLAAE